MEESQVRQDKVTKQWVIFAPARGKRPRDFVRKGEIRSSLPEYDESCPFCPGNEAKLTPIILETPHPREDLWQTRVVTNKYPALTPEGNVHRYEDGAYIAMRGFGRHEVIIESPAHNKTIATMRLDEAVTVIETYHRRYTDIVTNREEMMVVIFRNHGPRAGTSLIHPHSQLIATGWAPQYIRWKEEGAERYYDEWGRCVYCDILSFEMEERKRFIFENDGFFCFVPYAAEVPFEIWIMPKKHEADFGAIYDTEKQSLAEAMHAVLVRLHDKLHDPDYNYVINTAAPYRRGEPQLHWYLQVRPRLTTPAGFEIGSGISINPSMPEADAEFLTE
jgi:UDPglucose--hexose-1-phosphate uridylyltransferase